MAFLLTFVTKGFPEEQRMRLMRLVRFLPGNLGPRIARARPEVGVPPRGSLGKPQAWSQMGLGEALPDQSLLGAGRWSHHMLACGSRTRSYVPVFLSVAEHALRNNTPTLVTVTLSIQSMNAWQLSHEPISITTSSPPGERDSKVGSLTLIQNS